MSSETEHELIALRQYFEISEKHQGRKSYCADELLKHFNDDGSLKGEGRWRAAEIYKFMKLFVEAEAKCGQELDAIDWTIPTPGANA